MLATLRVMLRQVKGLPGLARLVQAQMEGPASARANLARAVMNLSLRAEELRRQHEAEERALRASMLLSVDDESLGRMAA